MLKTTIFTTNISCRLRFMFLILAVLILLIIQACNAPSTEEPTPSDSDEFVFGIILVGPHNDHGWSEAHYNGGQYVAANLPNSRMVFLESLNPSDRPDITLEEAVDDMVAEGAQLIFITSDDFAADTTLAADKYPDVVFMHISGDHVLKGNAPTNLGNFMGRMEYGKMIAGCAAALVTETGHISYLGPLINHETRRLANSTYLGARHCYEHYRGQDPEKLRFSVEWVGFWFHIPGVTADPTVIANNFFDSDTDIILSGIDTMEASLVAEERASAGEKVWVIPYDFGEACEDAPNICLGVPYFNWGPSYLKLAEAVQAGTWVSDWEWVGPNWDDINDQDSSAIGFREGLALTSEQSAQLQDMIADLSNDGSLILFQGPLQYQDGSLFLADGERASDEQIWYMSQLLTGMEGLSD
ncbi:MAG: BMP family ABC transporter substrate-binding protein [Chloroflexi bacterium]|nr:BMP family ABC transporter substrate-binding protein [Chloroflexota bacterium]